MELAWVAESGHPDLLMSCIWAAARLQLVTSAYAASGWD